MNYVIGDIHGELYKLLNLIEKLQINEKDKLIFIGDYIDKGLNSKGVVSFLIELTSVNDCVFLRGNHELMFMKALEGDQKAKDFFERYGGKQTFESYVGSTYKDDRPFEVSQLKEIIPRRHMEFFANTLPYHIVDGYLIVHAGIDFEKDSLDTDNEALYFIRQRFIESEMYYNSMRIVFGHTAFKAPYFDPYKIGIDTGAAYKEFGRLTAYNINLGYCINDIGEVFKDPFFI